MDIHELVRHIHHLPYLKRRQILTKLPNLNRFLYKYRALDPNDEESVDRIRDILVGSKLWLSSSRDFNDPFDMSAKLIVSGTVRERRKRSEEILKEQGLKHKQRVEMARNLAKEPINEFESFMITWPKRVFVLLEKTLEIF